MEKPLCKCHSQPMKWQKAKVPAGGMWRCKVVLKQQNYRSWLKFRYGITPEELRVREMTQHGKCGMCNEPPKNGRVLRLYIDDDHATGEVRGLLCSNCNLALGHYESKRKTAEAYLGRRKYDFSHYDFGLDEHLSLVNRPRKFGDYPKRERHTDGKGHIIN